MNNNRVYFSLTKVIWLYLNLSLCFFIDIFQVDKLIIAISVIVSIITVSFGHSIGLHRGIIHKGYTTSRTFRNVLLLLFVFTGLGSPLTWIKLHYTRDYWQNKSACHPYLGYNHSLWKDYIWYLHYSFRVSDEDLKEYNFPVEFYLDNFLKHLHKTWWLFNIIAALMVLQFLGFQAFIVLFPIRISINLLMHWFIGYISHTHGYREYIISGANESGYNDWV